MVAFNSCAVKPKDKKLLLKTRLFYELVFTEIHANTLFWLSLGKDVTKPAVHPPYKEAFFCPKDLIQGAKLVLVLPDSQGTLTVQ